MATRGSGESSAEAVAVDWAPRAEDLQVIRAGLRAFTDDQAGPVKARPLAVLVRDAAGRVVGGLEGELRWTWLFVARLWLPETLRGRGLGTAVLARAEAAAREQGATGAYLDSLETQAPGFYQRRGYVVYGVLEGFPPGSRRIYLRKNLTPGAA